MVVVEEEGSEVVVAEADPTHFSRGADMGERQLNSTPTSHAYCKPFYFVTIII